jgi:hypothetical protein
MRILRMTYWSPDLKPTVAVTRDSDLSDSLESVRNRMFREGAGMFLTWDIFEVEGDMDIREATMEAGKRTQGEVGIREGHMAMLYAYNLYHPNFNLVKRGGTIAQDQPSPLSVEEITFVFEQIAKHPKFKEKPVNMMAISEDFKIVQLSPDGRIGVKND